MSAALAADLSSGSIDTSLAEIDSRSRNTEWQSNGDIVVGPFSVLDMTPASCNEAPEPAPPPPPPQNTDAVEDARVQEPVHVATPPPVDMPSLALSPSSLMVGSLSQMDDFLHWSDLFDLAPEPSGLTPHPFLDAVDRLDFDPGPWPLTNSGDQSDVRGIVTPQKTPPDLTFPPVDIMTDAPFLLKHFQDRVIAQMMAMPLGEKSPWKILNVPAAVLTFSDLTFLGAQNISHARLANLYSLLACAALHLASNLDIGPGQSMEHWRQVADQTHSQAKDHMQMSLKKEIHEPKKAKYKDQLMAICGMTEYAVCFVSHHNPGDMADNIRFYAVSKRMHDVT